MTALPTKTVTYLPIGVLDGHRQAAIGYINNLSYNTKNEHIANALTVAALFLMQCELTTENDLHDDSPN